MKNSTSEAKLSQTAPPVFILNKVQHSQSLSRLKSKLATATSKVFNFSINSKIEEPDRTHKSSSKEIVRPAGVDTRIERWEGIGGMLKLNSMLKPQPQAAIKFPSGPIPAKRFIGIDSTGTKGVLLEFKSCTNTITSRPSLRPSSSLVSLLRNRQSNENQNQKTVHIQDPPIPAKVLSKCNIITWQSKVQRTGSPCQHPSSPAHPIREKASSNRMNKDEANRVLRSIPMDIITGRVMWTRTGERSSAHVRPKTAMNIFGVSGENIVGGPVADVLVSPSKATAGNVTGAACVGCVGGCNARC
jgi:hypothetical protein